MIHVENLRKSFGPITAVDNISFSAQQGDVLGFLGPNGAGKTTAMRMLTGYLAPDSGSAQICGHDILRDSVKVRQSLGYLAENAPAYNEMTVSSFLNFICDARQIQGIQRKAALDRVIDSCAIESVYHQSIETLSKGYRRRVGLAQALVHDPPVLILDEPTDGLDPNQKHEVRQLINAIAKDKCIIVSTHILEEVEAVCSRIIIIANGRILVDSTPDALKKEHNAELFDIFRNVTQGKKGVMEYWSTGRVECWSVGVLGNKGDQNSNTPILQYSHSVMNGFWTVCKRELKGYFATPVAYVFLVIFLFFSGYLPFKAKFFEMGRADLNLFFSNLPLLFVFMVPSVAMRLWAEERRSGSIELLLTLPITVPQAVLGKFLAAWAFMGIGLVLTFPMPLTVAYLGNPDVGLIVLGYLGSFLMAGAFLAVGCFFSAISKSQIISFILSVVACAVLVYAGMPTTLNYLAAFLPRGLLEAVEAISLQTHIDPMLKGILDLYDVAYFVLLIGGWIVSCCIILDERKANA